MIHTIRKHVAGASGLSYGLIVGLIAVVAIGTVTSIGGSVVNLFEETSGSLNTASAAGGGEQGGGTPAPTPFPVFSSCAETLANIPSLAGIDGNYLIDISGSGPVFNVYCDMTTDGGGWTMYYTTDSNFSLVDATTNTTAFGTDGYTRDLRDMPFTDILYVRHSDDAKDWFTNPSTVVVSSLEQSTNGSCVGSTNSPTGPYICAIGVGGNNWTGAGGADLSYSYQLTVGDNVWMQVGLMITGYNAGGTTDCFKRPDNWCGDISSNYYRVYGEANGVADSNGFGGVAFRQNGHTNVPFQLMSVGVR